MPKPNNNDSVPAKTNDERDDPRYDGYGYDYNDGRWDDDPNPYHGTYSED